MILTLLLAGCSSRGPLSSDNGSFNNSDMMGDPGCVDIPDIGLVVTLPPAQCVGNYTVERIEGEDSSFLVDCGAVTLAVTRWRTPVAPTPLLAQALVKGGTVTWQDEGGDVIRIVAEGVSDGELAEMAWSMGILYSNMPVIQVPEGFTFPTLSTYSYSPTTPPKPTTTIR